MILLLLLASLAALVVGLVLRRRAEAQLAGSIALRAAGATNHNPDAKYRLEFLRVGGTSANVRPSPRALTTRLSKWGRKVINRFRQETGSTFWQPAPAWRTGLRMFLAVRLNVQKRCNSNRIHDPSQSSRV